MRNPLVLNKAESFILFIISKHIQQQLEILKVKAYLQNFCFHTL